MTDIITATPASIARIQNVNEAAELARKAEAAAQIFDKVQNKHRNAQQARAVYLLAARRAGELLLEVPRSNGGRPGNSFELQLVTLYQEAKDAAGVSDYTAHVWQKLAGIPQDTMETYLHDPKYQLTEYTVNSLVTFAFGKRERVWTQESLIKTIGHYVGVYLEEFGSDVGSLVRAWGEWMRGEWR